MSKIYFVYIPKPYLNNPNAQVGLGLLSLATYARDLGSDVEIINGQAEGANWYPDIPDYSTVCISACSVDLPVVNSLGSKLREHGCYVMIGGSVVSSPLDISRSANCCIVDGPGEPMMIELSKGMRPHGFKRMSHYLSFGNYPFPDRGLLDYYGGNIFHKKTGVEVAQSTTLLTSRGCMFKCSFCVSGCSDAVYEYSLERIDEELDDIHGLGIENVRISDDNILANRKRFGELCLLLASYDMKWRASLRTKPNDIKLYELMRDSGCVELSFGIESGDEFVLRKLKKGAKVIDNSKAVENAIKAGIPNVRALMMMGTPGETKATLLLNKEWVRNHPEVTVCMCSFYPFPGTDIYNHPDEYGVKLEDDINNPNIYMFRSDGSEPEAHISIKDGLNKEQLTEQLLEMKRFLIERGQENEG